MADDFAETQQLPLRHPDPFERWEILTSPDRSVVLLNHSLTDHTRNLDASHFYVLDGSTLLVKKDWKESPAIKGDSYATSSTAIARDIVLSTPQYLAMSRFASKIWGHLWDAPERECIGHVTFLTDERIAFVCKKGLWVISTDGQVLFKDQLLKGESLGFPNKFSVSQDGKALAFFVGTFSDFWDTGGHTSVVHIAVYNSTNKPRALTIDVKPIPKNNFDFALSPDGSKLAVLNDRNISVYPIPVV